MPNRLTQSTSPYLRQHADNAVDWWPWGDDALAEARRLDRPILVSIGYSSCHWCHVMAHESFADPVAAAEMNAHFINIKVDREERPDVDALYMAALQAMTGRGGWPLNVFATPDGRPFYAGTYFPPAPRHGLPSWRQVVASVADAWRTRRADIEHHGDALVEALSDAVPAPAPDGGEPDRALLRRASHNLLDTVDARWGGFGQAPKFPQAGALSFLLRAHVRDGDAAALTAVEAAVDAMVSGGLNDHLAGGFHRYCVDREWTVPHFEKMLYDNAQLLGLLVDVWLRTGHARHADAARRTASYLLEGFGAPDGAFYCAQDADTAAGEGVYYTWTPAELMAVLGPADGALAVEWYGVTDAGNTEDARTVLTARADGRRLAAAHGLLDDELRARIEAVRLKLLDARRVRPAPDTDTKVLTGWNALAIDALARAGTALGEPSWVRSSVAAAEFILREVRCQTARGPRLAHVWTDGATGVAAFCDDTACFANACISLYEATFDARWADQAAAQCAVLVADFADPAGGAFRQTANHHPGLAVRQKDFYDAATPSGNAAACLALLRLDALRDEGAHEDVVASALRAVAPAAAAAPAGFGDTLLALDAYVHGVRSVTLSGDGVASGRLLPAVRSRFNPATVIRRYAGEPTLEPDAGADEAAQVCVRGRCHMPVADAVALLAVLRATDVGEAASTT